MSKEDSNHMSLLELRAIVADWDTRSLWRCGTGFLGLSLAKWLIKLKSNVDVS